MEPFERDSIVSKRGRYNKVIKELIADAICMGSSGAEAISSNLEKSLPLSCTVDVKLKL